MQPTVNLRHRAFDVKIASLEKSIDDHQQQIQTSRADIDTIRRIRDARNERQCPHACRINHLLMFNRLHYWQEIERQNEIEHIATRGRSYSQVDKYLTCGSCWQTFDSLNDGNEMGDFEAYNIAHWYIANNVPIMDDEYGDINRFHNGNKYVLEATPQLPLLNFDDASVNSTSYINTKVEYDAIVKLADPNKLKILETNHPLDLTVDLEKTFAECDGCGNGCGDCDD